ncbi:MAG: hypothetical protein Q8922_01070 [Bacteroidota bacterium]|nr:hypothetical protein [Bacteroidota bacterium]MDP4232181.1 hypothetical protein [Bacteroidota bacterium]MDP4241111.1 hypothetical protein [Bacteroidota bacterium]MDP4286503.1 hypothetical protein [Bacteroidota bacterium]
MRITLYSLAAAIGLAIALIVSLNSCAPSVNDLGTPNALVATPDTVRLAGLSASQEVSLRLNCGCTFIFDSVVSSGDVASILVTQTDSYKDSLSTHRVTFSAKPGAASGLHQAAYRFYTYDADTHADFQEPVVVFLTVP